MISYWHHPVVCLSVCLWRCILWLSGLVYRVKSGTKRVPSRHVPICPFRHFCCRMYRLATKCTTKKHVEETRVCISLYRLLTVDPNFVVTPVAHAWVSGFSKCVQKQKSEIRFFHSSCSCAWTCNLQLVAMQCHIYQSLGRLPDPSWRRCLFYWCLLYILTWLYLSHFWREVSG